MSAFVLIFVVTETIEIVVIVCAKKNCCCCCCYCIIDMVVSYSTQLLTCVRHGQTRRQVSKNDGHDLIHRTSWQLLLATSCWSVVVQQAAANSTSASSTHSRCTRRGTSTTVSDVRTYLRSAVHTVSASAAVSV